jgi:N-acetylglucosaminyl-diphospho-decaprenol L-rhamnosyltransferase
VTASHTRHHGTAPNGLNATAIVVTHNSEAHVADCLTALRRAGLAVLVVDNASTDETARLVATRFPAVVQVVNRTNAGFAAAVNQALAAVDHGIVLLVNPDCVLPASTARALVTLLEQRPEIGVAGPRLVGADGHTAISAHPFESLASVLASRFGGSLLPEGLRRLLSGKRRRHAYDACRHPGPPTTVDWVSGACMAVRTELLRELGGLDQGYFMYYEDEELCLRAWQRGARVCYVPAVEAIHVGGASSSDPSWIWPHLYRSMLRFFARHRPHSYPAVRAAVLLRALLGLGLAFLCPAPQRAADRARAWVRVARIAVTATADSIRGESQCTS